MATPQINKTPQQFFDDTARHLFEQGRPAVNAYRMCMYRAPDGCKCAVGCHIPDDLYSPKMERIDFVDNILIRFLPKDCIRLLLQLQSIHDGNVGDGTWSETADGPVFDQTKLNTAMRLAAFQLNLSPAVLDELAA